MTKTTTTIISTTTINDFLSKSFKEFQTLKLDKVVKNPVDFKNAVMMSCIDDSRTKATNELNAHIVATNKAEAVVSQADIDKKLGLFSAYNDKDMKAYNTACKFLVDAEEKRLELVEKREALTKFVNDNFDNSMITIVKDMTASPIKLQNWLLFKSICSGDYSKISKIFEPVLKSAKIYRTCKARQIEEKSSEFNSWNDTCKNLYVSFKNECESLFSLYTCEDKEDSILTTRHIKMSAGEFNNLADMLSGLSVEIDDKGVMRLSATKMSKFNKVLVKVLVMKKQDIKLVIE